MTPEHIKRVAELVTGLEWHIVDQWIPNKPQIVSSLTQDQYNTVNGMGRNASLYAPSFTGFEWQRSQALAVVEWLCANRNRASILGYIKCKDIESLMQMVLEVSGE